MIPFDFDALAGVAQLGLGLAGFSGIGLVLTRRAGRLETFELYRLGIMLGTAVGAMFLSLLPIAVAQFGAGGGAVCRLSAAIMAAYSVAFAGYFWYVLRYFRRTVPEIIGPVASRAVLALHVANAALQAISALGVLERCVGFYWLGLFWLLAHGTYQFWRILFVRPREAGDGAA
jgi:hypothetical protein